MDRRVDLTLNRDFRDREVPISRPRSIFKREEEKFIQTNGYMNSFSNYVTGTTMITNSINTIYSYSTDPYSTTNIISDYGNYREYGKTCDCCGKDITRLPWQQDIYACLCRSCSKEFENKHGRGKIKIPWK